MARRRTAKLRRQGNSRVVGGRCIAEGCPHDAVTIIVLEGEPRRLCEQHGLAVEMQLRRNEAAAKVKAREETEERLGL